MPYLLQAVRQGLQDLGARDLPAAHAALASGEQRVEARSSAAQVLCLYVARFYCANEVHLGFMLLRLHKVPSCASPFFSGCSVAG